MTDHNAHAGTGLRKKLFQDGVGSPRDAIDASANKLRNARPPPKRAPQKFRQDRCSPVLQKEKERNLVKAFWGLENEEFKDSFCLALCSRCCEFERQCWCGRGNSGG